MKKGTRYARLSAAAIAAVVCGASIGHAQTTLTWDAGGSNPPTDGSGNWDLTSQVWFNSGTSSVTTWWNSGDTAVFGNPTNTAQPSGAPTAYSVSLNAPSIVAQNIVLGESANDGFYSIFDQFDGGETLTLNGNLVKASAVGESVIELSSPMILGAGNHIVSVNDTSGAVPELAVDNAMNEVSGSPASITVNNAYYNSSYNSYGTFVLNAANNYSGGTNIQDGIITDNINGALGTGTVTIGALGCLGIGGEDTTPQQSMTISNPIVIQRNTYTGTDYSNNPGAIISQNSGNGADNVTFNGTFEIDSTNAQVVANTSTIVISSNITYGPDVQGGVLTLSGDTAGYVTLSGNNSALTGGIAVAGNVELNVSSLNNLGGATASLSMEGGVFHPVGGFITSFGSLNVNYPTFNGGIDVDPNTTFSISQNVGGASDTGGTISERGAGTLNLSGTDTLGGTSFWDGWSASAQGGGVTGGVINVTGDLSMGSLRLRSPTVNVTGTLTLTGSSYNSFGEDSTGTFGGPDQAIVNITGNGVLDETSNNDFNISDNANTTCTITVSGNGALTTNGNTYLGKSAGGVGVLNISGNGSYTNANPNQLTELGVNSDSTGTINQTGGSITLDRNGNFGFVLGDGRNAGGGSPVGTYNLSAGTFTDEQGEIYVGEGTNNGNPGIGVWNQTGGNVTFGNWFVLGREGAKGTVTISGNSTFTKDASNGGANVSIGEGGANVCTFTVEGNAVANIEIGQVYVGNNSSVGIMNVGSLTDPVNADPSFTVNDWFAIGRNGTSVGTLNLYDGSVTQQTQNFFDIGGDGGSAQGTVNVYGGTLTALNTWIGENGSCVGILNMNGGNASLGNIELALGNTANGTINLNGGTLSAVTVTALNNGGTGAPDFYFNGGVLTAPANETNNNFVGAKVVSIVSAGGAIMNPNGGYLNYNSALTHNSALGSTPDGGLTVEGTSGTIQLGTAGSHSPIDTYTGATTVEGGTTLIISTAGALPTGSNVANSASFVIGANSTAGNVSGTGKTTVNSGASFTASNFTQGALVNNGSTQINGTGTIGPNGGNGAVTGTGSLTIGTGTSDNLIKLATNSGGSSVGSLVVSTGSTLDITNNHLFINYGSGSDPMSTIYSYLKSGYNNGGWNGTGIISSSAQTLTNGLKYGIGFSDGADQINGHPIVTGLSSGQIELKYTLLGDANLDGTVNGSDFSILAANFGQGYSNWDQGNFEYTPAVNGTDFSALAANFGQGDSGADTSVSAADIQALDAFAVANGLPVPTITAVPEPASIGLLAVGGIVAMRRRRKA